MMPGRPVQEGSGGWESCGEVVESWRGGEGGRGGDEVVIAGAFCRGSRLVGFLVCINFLR